MTFGLSLGQTVQRGQNSFDSDYYIDGFKVYKNLTRNDSLKILKETVSKLNGKWTSSLTLVPTEPDVRYIWEYQLNDTTFKGFLFNLDVILAAPFVRLQILNGQVKIIRSRTIGEWLIDDSVMNIKINGDDLTIGDITYKRFKAD